jgi:hypothetical protein
MYNITRMLSEVALARAGFDENQIADVSRARNLPDWAVAQLGETQATRLAALRELANWRQMDSEELRETMTTAHFAAYMTNALSRQFYRDYGYQGGQWTRYIFQDTVPDFRNVDRFRMTEPENLVKRREKQNHRDGGIQPSALSYGVDEFSRKFDVSWRAILNDDLGEIQRTPQRMANAARRSLDSFVSNLYDNTTSQAALIALGALYAGTGRLTLANLAVGVNALKQRVDTKGNKVAINRITLVIPPVLEIQAAQILKDIMGTGSATQNVIGTFIDSVQVDPYISFSGSDVPWYLFADPNEIPAVTLARLQGWPGPIVAMRDSDIRLIQGTAPAAFLMGDLDTGDIVYLVEDVWGGYDNVTYGGITDPLGIYYSSGTTP